MGNHLYVFKLQTKIYQASIDGNVKKVRRLQKTLSNSYRAKLLAVRQISQGNQGKKTAKGSIARLLKKQKGKCNSCHLSFKSGDKIERDHIIPRQAEDNNTIDNLQLLHLHCHNRKTKRDLQIIKIHKYRKIWKEHFEKVHKHFENSKWMWIEDILTLV